ncbi:phage head completion protein [Nonomuraea recticatena]|uniref:Head-to-tail stopper n=1 Tax=Nonomuraea recticatena TaxID=46178 RepID=A0ABN3S0Q7_9ACTN
MVFSDTVTVYRAPVVDDAYGSSRDWEHASELGTFPAIVLPATSTEADDPDRETTTLTVSVYLRPTDVQATDRLTYEGRWFEVVGEPITWKGRTASYMRVRARRHS